jgi:hypothetical protein
LNLNQNKQKFFCSFFRKRTEESASFLKKNQKIFCEFVACPGSGATHLYIGRPLALRGFSLLLGEACTRLGFSGFAVPLNDP